jgi:hypothetical protein
MELSIIAVMALASACIILSISAMLSLKRFEQLYTMQIQAMTAIIYAIAEMRGYEEEDDPTDEEEHPKPELAPVLPFRGGPEGNDNDKDSKE